MKSEDVSSIWCNLQKYHSPYITHIEHQFSFHIPFAPSTILTWCNRQATIAQTPHPLHGQLLVCVARRQGGRLPRPREGALGGSKISRGLSRVWGFRFRAPAQQLKVPEIEVNNAGLRTFYALLEGSWEAVVTCILEYSHTDDWNRYKASLWADNLGYMRGLKSY